MPPTITLMFKNKELTIKKANHKTSLNKKPMHPNYHQLPSTVGILFYLQVYLDLADMFLGFMARIG